MRIGTGFRYKMGIAWGIGANPRIFGDYKPGIVLEAAIFEPVLLEDTKLSKARACYLICGRRKWLSGIYRWVHCGAYSGRIGDHCSIPVPSYTSFLEHFRIVLMKFI